MVCTFSGKPVDDSCEVEEEAPVCGPDSDGLVSALMFDTVLFKKMNFLFE